MLAGTGNGTLRSVRLVVVVLALAALGSAVVTAGGGGGSAVLSVAVGRAPVSLAVDERSGQVAVANYLDGSVSLLGLGAGARPTTVAVDARPTIVLAWPAARRLFVVTNSAAAAGRDTVTVLDAGGRHIQTIAVGYGATAATLDRRTARLFVANGTDSTVSMIDARSGRVLRTSPVGAGPIALAADERLGRVFVLTYGPPIEGAPVGRSGVTALDARTGTVLYATSVGHEAKALAVDGPRGHLFVANSDDNTVSMVDARMGTALRTLHVGAQPAALAINERTGRLVIANAGDGALSMIDTATGKLLRTVRLGDVPAAVAVDERRDRVVVLLTKQLGQEGTLPESGTVAVLDGQTGRVLRTVQTGLNPRTLAVDQATGTVLVADMLSGPPAESPLSAVRRWGQRWLSWLPALAPRRPPPAATGSITMFDP